MFGKFLEKKFSEKKFRKNNFRKKFSSSKSKSKSKVKVKGQPETGSSAGSLCLFYCDVIRDPVPPTYTSPLLEKRCVIYAHKDIQTYNIFKKMLYRFEAENFKYL